MSSLNVRRSPQLPPQSLVPTRSNAIRTHQGAPALLVSDELALRRAVCSCLLWEDTFYEDGEAVADRIVRLVGKVPPKVAADLACDARSHFNLRHVPLLIVSAMAAPGRGGTRLISDTLRDVIQRPDELSEFVAVYAKTYGVEPKAVKRRLSAQVKKGLAAAFDKFDAYQLAKYDREAPVRLRDVGFLAHVRSGSSERGRLMANLLNRSFFPEATRSSGFRVRDEYGLTGDDKPNFESSDTWEVALSAGGDKKEVFTEQLQSGKLGYLALLRNLRNMEQAGVDRELVEQAILARRGARRVLPFRYVAAARAAPAFAGAIDQALGETISQLPQLGGRTVVLVDVSGSMDVALSGKSDLTRIDAAATLASIIPGDLRVFTFSERVVEVPPDRGMRGIEAIRSSQQHGGTWLGRAIAQLQGQLHDEPVYNRYVYHRLGWRGETEPSSSVGPVEMDRLIVITDEQSHDAVPESIARHAYMINVAPYRYGVGYGEMWTHIDGFSEQVLRFIGEFEQVGFREQ